MHLIFLQYLCHVSLDKISHLFEMIYLCHNHFFQSAQCGDHSLFAICDLNSVRPIFKQSLSEERKIRYKKPKVCIAFSFFYIKKFFFGIWCNTCVLCLYNFLLSAIFIQIVQKFCLFFPRIISRLKETIYILFFHFLCVSLIINLDALRIYVF